MNARERFLVALRNGVPDRAPAAPDISNMVPCRLTGKPFWDIYLHGDPPLWRAHLHANRRYGFDAWFYRGTLNFDIESTNQVSHQVVGQDDERITRQTTIRNRAGVLTRSVAFFRSNSPWTVEKPIKDPVQDIPCWIESMGTITGYTTNTADEMRAELRGEFALGFGGLRYPGFQYWVNLFDGGLPQMLDVHQERPDLLEALREAEHRRNVEVLSHYLKEKPDYVFLGASGTLTIGSPALFRQYGLPTLKELTRMAAENGVPVLLHSCGRERELVKIAAAETDLTCINPLEPPPMGDCDLAEVNRSYGERIALMGNLHTTDVMLHGTRQVVIDAAAKAIEEAGPGGGFILSTGDQCGRDTPDENLYALVEAAERYGRY
jgi:uroporphyrinogen decarboxylase